MRIVAGFGKTLVEEMLPSTAPGSAYRRRSDRLAADGADWVEVVRGDEVIYKWVKNIGRVI